ncbi:MAG TPA: LuxR C-terminal-related transcriptional regulator [Solirubrobacteraceae bacterium]|nr:LuxR C-terminal-related transcriptional regulator [Solirubrobacteraceae bacterium]
MTDDLRARVEQALAGDVDDVVAAYDALDEVRDKPELLALREELAREAVTRLKVLERVRAAVARLNDAGPVSEIIERAPAEAAAAIELDRVLLSRVEDGWLVGEALHWEGDAKSAEQTLARLRAAPAQIAYPLIEGELLRRRRAAIVTAAEGDPGTRQANWDVMRWEGYVAAPVIMEGRVAGFLHGDRAAAELRALDRDALARFAEGFSEVYERAVLRRRLRVERQELRRIATWADARTAELSDGAIDLARDRQPAEGADAERPPARSALRDLLTPRELDVLEHLVRGETNADIARSLVLSEGTVKFHVKNILRKMNAANRAEATSRYLRLSLRRDG